MSRKTYIGFVICFLTGLSCGLLSIPAPAPPVLTGALIVLAITTGSIITEKYMHYRQHKETISKGATHD